MHQFCHILPSSIILLQLALGDAAPSSFVLEHIRWREDSVDREELPPDMPEPLGKEVDLCLYNDSSHANDKMNRRSRRGFFVFQLRLQYSELSSWQ